MAKDGVKLAGTLFRSDRPSERVVVMSSALGVTRKHYARFACYLADNDLSVVTFDYRGFGGSGPAWGTHLDGGIRVLAERDLWAVIEQSYDIGSDVSVVGHSLGAMALQLLPDLSRVERIISVASGSGYWRLHGFPGNVLRLFLWGVVVPRVARVHGYFPGRALRLLTDMPRPVADDLSRMCRSPAFLHALSDSSAPAPFRGHLWVISFTDDEIVSARAVEDLHRTFSAGSVAKSHLSPQDLGRHRIGHFGAFRPGCEPLWAKMARWLRGEDADP